MSLAELDEAVIVALGSNVPGGEGSRALLKAALDRFGDHGLRVKARSRWWRSAAWPDPSAPAFLNGVALLQTASDATTVLNTLLALEETFGRRRGELNAPRSLDLDLIAYGYVVAEGAALTLPHPRAHERLFVMGPLAEIAPGWVHPTLGRTAGELAGSATVGRDAAPA